jgi:hypothetical protein
MRPDNYELEIDGRCYMYFERNFDGEKPTDNWDLIKGETISKGGKGQHEPVHPDYYKGNNKDGKAIEVFDIIDQFVDGDFYLGNVLKYVCRAGKKSKETKKQDLEKAMHYIMEAIKRCNKETSSSEEDKKC